MFFPKFGSLTSIKTGFSEAVTLEDCVNESVDCRRYNRVKNIKACNNDMSWGSDTKQGCIALSSGKCGTNQMRGFAKAVHEVEAAQDDARLDQSCPERVVPVGMEYLSKSMVQKKDVKRHSHALSMETGRDAT